MVDPLEPILDQLVGARLIELVSEKDWAYLFQHALTQESAYHSLLLKKRRELHRLVAEAYETLYAENLDQYAALLAQHYLEARDDAKTVVYGMRAGDAAQRVSAHTEARMHYAHALAALARLPAGEANRRARLDLLTRQFSVSIGTDITAEDLAQVAEALTLAGELPGPDGTAGSDRLRRARVLYWAGRLHFLRNELRAALDYYRQALSLAEELGDESFVATAAGAIGRTLAEQGRWDQAEPLLARSVEPLAKTGHWFDWVVTLAWLGIAHTNRGEYARGIRETGEALARAEQFNTATMLGVVHVLRATAFLAGREHTRMMNAARATVAAGERAGDTLWVYLGYFFWALAETRLKNFESAAQKQAEARLRQETASGPLLGQDMFLAGEAELLLFSGEAAGAVTMAENAAALARAAGNVQSEGTAERIWALALHQINPSDRARVTQHLKASVGAFESGDGRLEIAHTHAAWGRVCLDHGARPAARLHLELAAAQFQASGLAAELERTRELLTETGHGTADP